MPNLINLSGQEFGRLTVVGRSTKPSRRVAWECICECGNTTTVTSDSLMRGSTQSCGCLQRARTAASNTERAMHGHARGHSPSPEWYSWKTMNERCGNPRAPNYHLYGGRGISVCQQWRGKSGFIQFLADMGSRPKGMTLDRINTDGDYEPSNCRWADAKTQARNRRQTREYKAKMKANLDAGRRKMWSDPEIRARLIESRRRKQAQQGSQ